MLRRDAGTTRQAITLDSLGLEKNFITSRRTWGAPGDAGRAQFDFFNGGWWTSPIVIRVPMPGVDSTLKSVFAFSRKV